MARTEPRSHESPAPAATGAARPVTGGTGGIRDRVPSWFGVLFAAIGVLCALTALSRGLRESLRPVLNGVDAVLVPASPNLAYAVFLFLLAAALSARKRAAWWIVTGYWLLLLVADLLLLGLDREYSPAWEPPVSAAVALAALVVLLWARGAFYARVRRGAFWRALGVLAAGLALSVLAGWLLVALFPGTLPSGQYLGYAADRVFGGLADGGRFDGQAPRLVRFLLGLLGALSLLAAAAALFRSQRARAGLHPDDETRLRLLLARHGERDSLGYFATRRDKNVVFSPDGEAAIAYRVEAGVCLAGGDPVGSRSSWDQAIAAWLATARRYAWAPAVMGAGEDAAGAYARAGLGALHLGDEAVLELAGFDLEGRDMKAVRQAANRLRRQGAVVRIRRHRELSAIELAELVRTADAWRDTATERGFSMALGRLGDPADGDCLLAEAFDGDGPGARRIGLLSFVPWGADGVSLDVMRRAPDAPNGVMEFMVSELAAHGRAMGISRVSLNFAVFRAAFEEGARIGAGPVLRSWRSLLLFLSRWWQLEALYRSNVKYRPLWYRRYLCYAEPRMLARTSLASGIAEGFVALPGLTGPGRRGVLPPVSAAGLPPLTEEDRALAAGERPAPQAADPYRDAPEQLRVRLRTLDRLRAQGVECYPADSFRTHTLAEVREAHPALPPGTRTGERARVTGRLMLVRDFGGVVFAVLRDWSGDLQLMLTRDETGAGPLDRFTADLDLGDQLEAAGEIGTSDRGELSLVVGSWRLLAKCLRPLPDKRRGLTDPEARVRRRYLDLAVRPEARQVLAARSRAVQALRSGLLDRGFLEVETPILQQIHGGANARPFTTHINAYDLDLYLRIAPELYLKRLCVGGMERVFELGRTFRNEGTSFKHNPEFTMLEAYQAGADYRVMLDLTRELIQGAATAAHGSPVAVSLDAEGRRTEHDISGLWPVKTVHGAISEALGEEVDADTGAERLRELCRQAGVPHPPDAGRGDIVLEMYERLVEKTTALPAFYLDFPTDVSPLTRQHRTDPRLAERWDLVAFGTELATAYSELTDPVEQRRRLTAQSLLAADGDPEAMELDEDFLTALEYAMPPTGGLGMGVDRLVMFLTGLSIRETLPFPLVRGQ